MKRLANWIFNSKTEAGIKLRIAYIFIGIVFIFASIIKLIERLWD